MASNSMIELIKMLPSRNADGEDGGGEIQPEDYIDGSSELSPLIVDNGLESKLNRLVGFMFSFLFFFIEALDSITLRNKKIKKLMKMI